MWVNAQHRIVCFFFFLNFESNRNERMKQNWQKAQTEMICVWFGLPLPYSRTCWLLTGIGHLAFLFRFVPFWWERARFPFIVNIVIAIIHNRHFFLFCILALCLCFFSSFVRPFVRAARIKRNERADDQMKRRETKKKNITNCCYR